jgi:hypothetical protein
MWTIVPEEALFPGKDDININSQSLKNELALEEIEYDGCKVLAQAVFENQYQIVRIISTKTDDYLNNKLEPGKIIQCKKTFEAF